MPFIDITLSIPKDELLRWYAGGVQHVSATSSDGRRVRFPVQLLRPYVKHNGVYGRFKIEFTEAGKFVSIAAQE